MAHYQPSAPKLQEQDLEGKLAIVTGATKGIGRAIALDLATRGCSILGTYSSAQSAHNFDTLSHSISDLYSASPTSHQHTPVAPTLRGVAADITSLSTASTPLNDLERYYSGRKLDILVLNASIYIRPRIGSASESDIAQTLTANIHWPIALLEKLVQRQLFEANSRVVIVSSDRARDPMVGSGLFGATRAAMESLTRSWALELPLLFPGTTVNAVSVGLTDTLGLRGLPAAEMKALKGQGVGKVKVVEGGRMGQAEDVAGVVGWLVSEKARWVTGSVVAANGGAAWVGGSS